MGSSCLFHLMISMFSFHSRVDRSQELSFNLVLWILMASLGLGIVSISSGDTCNLFRKLIKNNRINRTTGKLPNISNIKLMNEPCDQIIHTSLSCLFVLWPLGLWKRAQSGCGNCMVAQIYLIILTAQASFLFETNWFLQYSFQILSLPGETMENFILLKGLFVWIFCCETTHPWIESVAASMPNQNFIKQSFTWATKQYPSTILVV